MYWIATICAVFLSGGLADLNWRHLALSLAFLPYINDKGLPLPILAPGWTLNYEMLFYFVAALSILVSENPRRRFVLIVSALGALILMRSRVSQDNLVALRWTSPLLAEFILGILIASGLPWLLKAKQKLLLMVLLLGAAVLYVLLISRQYDGGPRVITAGVPSALVLMAFIIGEAYLRAKSANPLKLIGDASYSLYLSHPFVIVGVGEIVSLESHSHRVVYALFALCASVCFGVLLHLYLERPLTRVLRGAP